MENYSAHSEYNETMKELNVRELGKSYVMYKVGEAINKSYFPILVPLGIIRNFLSFLVMLLPHNRRMSISLYISVLAVTDSVTLSIALCRYLNQVVDIDFHSSQDYHCTLVMTALFTASLCSTLFIMSMTFDRFYSIIRPHKAASFNTVKRARITIISITLFSILFNLPYLYQTISEGRSCIPNGKSNESIYGQLYYWLSFSLSFAFPFIALLIMNCVIIQTLCQRSANTLALGQGQGQVQHENEASTSKIKTSERQIYIILLLVTFGFLILVSPSYLFVLYSMLYNFKQSPSFAGYYLFFNVAQKLHYTNSGINFFLYVISGKKFRTDLINLFKCFKTKKMQNNSISVNSTSSEVTKLQ